MFTITTEDVRGVPTQVWADAPDTLLDVWALGAGHGDATFLVYEDEPTCPRNATGKVLERELRESFPTGDHPTGDQR